METLETEKNAKKCQIFRCERCDFICNKTSNYEKHLLTKKHILSHDGNTLGIFGNKMETPEMANSDKPEFKCNCGKTYTTRAGLWKHKKMPKNATKCQKTPNTNFSENDVIKNE